MFGFGFQKTSGLSREGAWQKLQPDGFHFFHAAVPCIDCNHAIDHRHPDWAAVSSLGATGHLKSATDHLPAFGRCLFGLLPNHQLR